MQTEKISSEEAGRRMGLCQSRVRQLLQAGLILNAERLNPESRYRSVWVVEVPIGEAPRRITNG
jgi:hypothetical protein